MMRGGKWRRDIGTCPKNFGPQYSIYFNIETIKYNELTTRLKLDFYTLKYFEQHNCNLKLKICAVIQIKYKNYKNKKIVKNIIVHQNLVSSRTT